MMFVFLLIVGVNLYIPPGATAVVDITTGETNCTTPTITLPEHLSIPLWIEKRLYKNLHNLTYTTLPFNPSVFWAGGDNWIAQDSSGKIISSCGEFNLPPADHLATGDIDNDSKPEIVWVKGEDIVIYSIPSLTKEPFKPQAKGHPLPCIWQNKLFISDEEGVFLYTIIRGRMRKKRISTSQHTLIAGKNGIYGDEGMIYPKKEKLPWDREMDILGMIDVNGDQKLDIIVRDKNGEVAYYPSWKDTFLFPPAPPKPTFIPIEAPAPSLDIIDDSTMVIGTGDGVVMIKKPNSTDTIFTCKSGYAIVKLTKDGDIVVGERSGDIYILKGKNHTPSKLPIKNQEGYSAPAVLNGKIIYGTGKGHLIIEEDTLQIDTTSIIPAVGDYNNDKIEDIVVGTLEGYILFLKGPGFTPDTILKTYVGELPAPTLYDIDKDGTQEVIVSTAEGNIYILTKQDGRFVETNSFRMDTTQAERLMEGYYPLPAPFVYLGNQSAVDSCLSLLKNCPPNIADEVAFALATLPTGVITAMYRMGELNLLVSQAKEIYAIADSLPYADLIETKDGTTILYNKKDTLPPEYYYFYVAHPRILYEIPAHINAEFWEKPPQHYGMTREEWLTHKWELYGREGIFWRPFLLRNDLFGKPLLERLRNVQTLREAVDSIFVWQGWNAGGGMTFGYLTQDLQPVQIYRKQYGSCGEQSILFCAAARCALIPTYVVTDRGEDHQWNEFWDEGKWHHLDANQVLCKGIDNPCISSEGMKKTVSCVLGWRGDDIHFYARAGGYTGFGLLSISVIDSTGNPIDGALVRILSHWDKRNSLAVWGYTNTKGEISFHLGYQPFGYTIQIVSPMGITGSENIFIREGDTLHLAYTLPVKLPSSPPSTDIPKDLQINIESACLRIRNLVTGKPYRIESAYLRDTVRYKGSGIWEYPVEGAKLTAQYKGGKLILHNPHLLTGVWATVERKTETIHLPHIVHTEAEDGFIKIITTDGEGYITINTESLYVRGKGEIIWHPEGGYLPAGEYIIKSTFRGETGDSVKIEVKPTRIYRHQTIYQDAMNAELTASWRMGPIKVEKGTRWMYIHIEGETEGMDLDLYLYRDKDNDGKITKKERVKVSGSPSDRETISIFYPKPGIYYIYVHGYTVPGGKGKFTLRTSFLVDHNRVLVE